VFTQGQAGKAEHVLLPGDIPVMQVDRGGQVTYHGPGQLVAYLMLDVRRSGIGVRELVSRIERSLIDLLASYDVQRQWPSRTRRVCMSNGAKIASLGLRIRNGRSFHGLALNVDMDLEPFQRINPCGYAGMAMTQLADQVDGPLALSEVSARLREQLIKHLGYAQQQTLTGAA
jgi:lipoyl(octanoyl) transferase